MAHHPSIHTTPEPPATAAAQRPLSGKSLRFICIDELLRHPQRTVAQLVTTLERYGYAVPGRASKTISDALRWEVRRGRIQRLGRGLYRYVTAPRSTARRIRMFASACHAWIVATTRNEPPPPTPKPCARRYRWANHFAPEAPWPRMEWLWTR